MINCLGDSDTNEQKGNNMKHYVVVLDWATNDEENVDILGVRHTFEEAEELFNTHLDHERNLAEEKGYIVTEDFKGCFVAQEESYYSAEHTRLLIMEVD